MGHEKINSLLYQKRRLLFFLLAVLSISYFGIPFALIYFPDIINQPILYEDISWTWLYTFLQIPMTWLLGWIYWQKAKQFDKQVQVILQEGQS